MVKIFRPTGSDCKAINLPRPAEATKGLLDTAAALKSMIDRPLPKLPLLAMDGRPLDTSSLRGKVLLLNFFASW
jgi:hypothetical protein